MNWDFVIISAIWLLLLLFEHQRNRSDIQKINNRIDSINNDYQKFKQSISKYVSQKFCLFTEEINILKNQIKSLSDENKKLSDKNGELLKRLAFYAEIDNDSTLLNESDNSYLLDMVNQDSYEELLDDEQNSALFEMENTDNNIFVTGKAGTGKSFLLDAFSKRSRKKAIKLAPTGIAALNISGVTLHSAFGFYNLESLDIDNISNENIKLKSEKRILLQNIEVIIIDEISMVRADTFDKIDKLLKVINNTNSPFGGKQIILFGDPFQLPPIAKNEERKFLMKHYGGIFFFQSNAYKTNNFHFVELTQNHRQKDDFNYFEILNHIREGKTTDEDIIYLNSRQVADDQSGKRILTLFPTKAEAEYINKIEMEQIKGKEYVYTAKIVECKYSDQTPNLESQFPIVKDLKLKVGALVMMVANDPSNRWVNGTMAIIKRLTYDYIIVSIDSFNYQVDRMLFTEQEAKFVDDKIEYENVLTVSQFPIVPAYAITIHKSQGKTFPQIACDLSKCFENGQAYVALSRCSSLEGLNLINKVHPENIKVDQTVQNFYIQQLSNMSSPK